MTSQELRNKISQNFDFVNLKRYDYSMKRLMVKHENGVTDTSIAAALNITEEEVTALYQSALANLRKIMKVE